MARKCRSRARQRRRLSPWYLRRHCPPRGVRWCAPRHRMRKPASRTTRWCVRTCCQKPRGGLRARRHCRRPRCGGHLRGVASALAKSSAPRRRRSSSPPRAHSAPHSRVACAPSRACAAEAPPLDRPYWVAHAGGVRSVLAVYRHWSVGNITHRGARTPLRWCGPRGWWWWWWWSRGQGGGHVPAGASGGNFGEERQRLGRYLPSLATTLTPPHPRRPPSPAGAPTP